MWLASQCGHSACGPATYNDNTEGDDGGCHVAVGAPEQEQEDGQEGDPADVEWAVGDGGLIVAYLFERAALGLGGKLDDGLGMPLSALPTEFGY